MPHWYASGVSVEETAYIVTILNVDISFIAETRSWPLFG